METAFLLEQTLPFFHCDSYIFLMDASTFTHTVNRCSLRSSCMLGPIVRARSIVESKRARPWPLSLCQCILNGGEGHNKTMNKVFFEGMIKT